MSVSYDKILTKMMEEIRQASMKQEQVTKMKEHIKSVKLLTELILEEQPMETSSKVVHNEQKTVISSPSPNQSSIDHEEANGNSIFDF